MCIKTFKLFASLLFLLPTRYRVTLQTMDLPVHEVAPVAAIDYFVAPLK